MRLVLELDDATLDALADRLALRLTGHASPVGDPLVGPADLNVPVRTWRRAIKSGALKAHKVGRQLLARRSDATAWLGQLEQPVRLVQAANDDSGDDTDEEIQALLQAGKLRRVK